LLDHGGRMTEQVQEQNREWTREEVVATLRTILVDSLGAKEAEVVPSASLVRDLGAESIDFLDLGFKVQQTFGVNFQASEIRNRIVGWGTLILQTLAEILEARYGVKLTNEELRPLEGGGLTKVLEHVYSTQRIAPEPDAVTQVGQELIRRLNKEFSAFGLVVSEADARDLTAIMQSNFGSRRLVERLLDLLTVQALANFISANLGPRLRPD
jgi:acyl carrier protein